MDAMKINRNILLAAAVAGVAGAAFTSPASAAVHRWNVDSGGDWSNADNWHAADGVPPSDAETIIRFVEPTGTITTTNDLGTPNAFTLNQIEYFHDVGATVIINGDDLNFVANGGTPAAIRSEDDGALTIQSNIAINDKLILGGDGSGEVLITGVISGSGELARGNGGATGDRTARFILRADNTYTGQTILHGSNSSSTIGAVIRVHHNNALGATGDGNGTQINSGGMLEIDGSGPNGNLTLSEAITVTHSRGSNLGTGVAPGSIINVAGDNSLSTVVTLNPSSTSANDSLFVSHSGTLTYSAGLQVLPANTLFTQHAFGGAGNQVVNGIAQNDANLEIYKVGSGTVTLNGNLTQNKTFVRDGLLVVNGSTTSTSELEVRTGGSTGPETYSGVGVLGGNGTIGGAVRVFAADANSSTGQGAAISPGDPASNGGIGALTMTHLRLQGADTASEAARFIAQVFSSTEYDQAIVTTQVDLNHNSAANGAILDLTIDPSFSGQVGEFIALIDNQGTGGIAGMFQGVAESAEFDVHGYTFAYTYTGGTGNDFGIEVVAVPEPTMVGLLGLGGLLALRRRR